MDTNETRSAYLLALRKRGEARSGAVHITRTFIRTPETGNGDGLPMGGYIAHSVPSIRHAPDGVTFDQIMQDHRGQSVVDEEAPLNEHEAAFHLVRCIEAGLVGVLETRTVKRGV